MLSKKGTVIIFLSVLFLPFILNSLNIQALFAGNTNTENRSLAKKPVININSLDGYPSQYSDYYNDEFPFRDVLLESYAYIKTRCFDESPIPEKVIIGKDKWLYNIGDELGSCNGTKKMSDSTLNAFLNELKRREEYLKQRNCSMYIFIAPVKLVVYPEYMKRGIETHGEQTEGEQLVEYIKKHSDIHITYLLSTLQKAKSPDKPRLYYKADTHWSDYGAFVGYKEMMRQLSDTFKNLKPLSENDLATHDTEYDAGNLSVMMKVQNYFIEKRHEMYPKNRRAIEQPNKNYPAPDNFPYPWQFQRNTADTTLPRLLVIGDSFMVGTMGFLSESFSHTAFIFDAWQYKLNENIIEGEKPNIVIYIMWEPKIDNMITKRIL